MLLVKEVGNAARAGRVLEHVSLPALHSKGRLQLMRQERERAARRKKQQQKLERRLLRREHKLARQRRRQMRQHMIRQQEIAHEQVLAVEKETAAGVIQKSARRRLEMMAVQKEKDRVAAATDLQRMIRGYAVCRKLAKVEAMTVRVKEKLLNRWRALVTIIIRLMRWLQRSRHARWCWLLGEVRRAMQPSPNDKFVTEPQIVSRPIPGTNGKSSPSQQTRASQGKRRKRRASCISAITSYTTRSGVQESRGVQRLSVIDTSDASTLAIEIRHIASSKTTTIKVDPNTWARLGKGKLENMDQAQREEIYRHLLDFCLLTTGRIGATTLFESVPQLHKLYSLLTRIPRRAAPGTKAIAEIFAERLQMQFIEPGKVLYEEGTIGKQMFFVRTGKIVLVRQKLDACAAEIMNLTNLVRRKKGMSAHAHEQTSMQTLLESYEVLATLGPGDQLGELGLFQDWHGTARLATAVSVERCELFSMHANDLALVAEHAATQNQVRSALTEAIYSWVQRAIKGEMPMTPDLDALQTLLPAKTARWPADGRRPTLRRKLQRAARVAMVVARWKKLTNVEIDLNAPEVSILWELRNKSEALRMKSRKQTVATLNFVMKELDERRQESLLSRAEQNLQLARIAEDESEEEEESSSSDEDGG